MGYTTDFYGEFSITPPLEPLQIGYLKKFADTRRMQRVSAIAEIMEDPMRVAVGLPIGVVGEYFVGGLGFAGQDHDDSVSNYNSPPASQPHLWCQWIPSEDGAFLEWDGGEKFSHYIQWLEYLIEHFFKRWDRIIDGQVRWQGEEPDDRGVIYARNNEVQAVRDVISQPKQNF
jgi:hypothetical protein